MVKDFDNVAFGLVVTMAVSKHFFHMKPSISYGFVFMLRKGLDFSEESIEKSYGKESANESGSKNGDCGTGSQSDNTVGHPPWVHHPLDHNFKEYQVTKIIDVENWRIKIIVSLFEWNPSVSSMESSIQSTFRFSLEDTDECEELQLQATSNFKADHVDAYDSDCDDEATVNEIFMANLSPVGSLNDDTVAPRYDSNTLSEVPHYDTYHDSDVLNSNIQELGYIENIISTNESYDELKGNSDVISFTDYMLIIGEDTDNYVPPPVQKDDMMLSVIEQMKSQVKNCNKCKSIDVVLLDLQESNKSLSELQKHFAKLEEYNITLHIAFQNHKEQMILNDPDTINKQLLVKTINNQSVEIDDLKVKLIRKIEDENVSLAFQVSSLVKEREHIKSVSSTNASESKLRSNTKNDRIPQPSSRRMKNKVESHHRKFKSSANKNNHVSDCNVNVKNVSLSKNSDTISISCNEYLFFPNHDACVVQYLKKMQTPKVAKSAKQKVTSEWKPAGRIFKTLGLKWVPTGRMFTLVESKCSSSPSRNTTTKILPNRQIPKNHSNSG
ncbi:hypothetical protein Tco_1102262 [Tanacetum coccineum]